MADSPATVVLCGGAIARRAPDRSPAARRGSLAVRHDGIGGQPPVTWIVRLEDLLREPDGPVEAAGQGDAVALALEPAWLDSRRALRTAIRQAHEAVPELDAAVLTGVPLREHGLLAELGIRVVAVDHIGRRCHGCRRPAPPGWACRNVTWGLWEVAKTNRTRRPGLWQRLALGGGLPSARAGSLEVLCDEEAGAPGLVQWIRAIGRRQARGSIVAVRLGDLAGLLDRRGMPEESPSPAAGTPRGSLLAAA